jgi:hypothetical protein
MDPSLLVTLFDQFLDPALDSGRALALFGELLEKDHSTWKVKPKKELRGIREVIVHFYQRNQTAEPPADIQLILATPWEVTASKLEALFGGPIRWAPSGPAIGRRRSVSIASPAKKTRLRGVVSFELDKTIQNKRIVDLSIVDVLFRQLPS